MSQLERQENYSFGRGVRQIRISLQWSKHQRPIAFSVFRYDFKARLSEVLRSENYKLTDGFIKLESAAMVQKLSVDFTAADGTSAFAITVDGFENFNSADEVIMECSDGTNYSDFGRLFHTRVKMTSTYQGICMCVFYIDGFYPDSRCRWIVRAVEDPMFAYSISEQEDFCDKCVVSIVPSFEKFRFHLFGTVGSICAALSSQSLPLLKDKFLVFADGVSKQVFTELIFNNLYETHKKIIEPEEATYAVSLIHELFHSIDFSGDDLVSWEEFTAFVIKTIVEINGEVAAAEADEYVIEYEEDFIARDRFLSSHIPVISMKYVSETKTILIVPAESELIYVFNSNTFHLRSQINPASIIDPGNISHEDQIPAERRENTRKKRCFIFDVVYLSGKDFYCFSSDDHSITVCKEIVILGGKRVTYNQVSRIVHSLLHPMLCWSHNSQVLCSISTSNILFGWNIDTGVPIYQSTRHNSVVTALIVIRNLDVFVTASMDKHIILQSAGTGRVKAVLKGHARGIKCVDANSEVVISGGFEGEAKVWSLDGKDVCLRLQGHRTFIVAVKLMTERAFSERDHRAVTVADDGEFRIWDIWVSEKFVEPPIRAALQAFEMYNPQMPMNRLKFIALSFDDVQKISSFHATIYACGSKLLKFKPKKRAKDFLTAACCTYNAAFGIIMLAVGRNVFQYDITTGKLVGVLKEIASTDITVLYIGDQRGHTYYIGTNSGDIMSINFRAGTITSVVPSISGEISCIRLLNHALNESFYIISSLDGSIMQVRETEGSLWPPFKRNNDLFGPSAGISTFCIVEAFTIVIAISNKNKWCVWNITISVPIINGQEVHNLCSVELIGTSIKSYNDGSTESQRLVTFALGGTAGIHVYTYDILSAICVSTMFLAPELPSFINHVTILCKGASEANYTTPLEARKVLVASTDDGFLLSWNVDHMQETSEKKYKTNLSGMMWMKRRSVYDSHTLKPASTKKNLVPPTGLWKAHNETITGITTLDYYGCTVSVSNDGFVRVWTMHQECLGEMRLPNITDEMREFQLKCVKNGLWNFIVERKMYSDEEQKTALKLVRAIVNCGDKDRKGDSRPVSRDPFRLSSPSIDRITDILFRVNSPKLAARVTLDDKADLNRFIQLSSLVEPSVAASSQISQALDNASSSLGFSLHSFTSLPALGTPLSISANTSVADLAFGNQTCYYKNAEKVFKGRKKDVSAQLKHRVQLNRIERKIRSMKLDSGSSARRDVLSASWDFISMGELLTLDKDAIEEVNSQMRMYKSSLLVPPDAERRPLDRKAILAAGDRLEEQVQQELKRKVVRVETRTNIRQKRREKEVHEERAALEKKVQAAILSVLAPSIVENEAPVTVKLKTRDILPSYTINDVNDFITLIAQVDVDFSGSLDINEWVRLFTSTGSTLEVHQAVSMFDGAETKAGGKLHISDLVPMIFPKASKHQKKIIIKYVEAEIFAAKSLTVAATSKEYLSTYDMERLFECYDSRGINYVPLRYIRERLNLLQLPLNILVEVTHDLYGDEYVSVVEFLKLFRLFISDKHQRSVND